MYTKEEILEMLQNGQEAEDLAQSFIDALNGAIEQKKELDDAAAKAEREKMRIRSDKISIMDEMLKTIFEYIKRYYPKVYSENIYEEITATDVVDAMDEAYAEICKFTNTLDDFLKILEANPEEKNVKTEHKEVNFPDFEEFLDPIEKFLRENHLN